MLAARVLPIVAVQIDPGAPAPDLEAQLLRACSSGLERARCVSSRAESEQAPKGIAIVSWDDAGNASIEVGLAHDNEPSWISRQLSFAPSDPEVERWRAVGLTIALLVDDPRFWEPEPPAAPPPAQPLDTPPAVRERAPADTGLPVRIALRALTGVGVVSGPWRWGGEMRLSVPLSSRFFATGSIEYALARDTSLDVRWFDVSAGVGLDAGPVLGNVRARLRLELRGENVGVTQQRGQLTDRRTAWVPGVALGGDLDWPLSESWLVSARADAFLLDGSTGIDSADQHLAFSAGAGVLLGLGAGYHF